MKLIIVPDSAGYAAARGPEVLSVELDGGAPYMRRDILNAAFKVDVQWVLDIAAYDYINAFFRYATEHGSEPFELDMILDYATVTEYEDVRFVPGSLKLTQQRGLTYWVAAQLSVTPPFNATEASEDAATIAAYEAANP